MPWVISARSADALVGQAEKLLAHLRRFPLLDPVDVGFSLVTTRSIFEHRAVVLGRNADELVAGLSALIAGVSAPGLVSGRAGIEGRIAFLFPGQGSQSVGMGAALYEQFPVYADSFDALCGAFDEHLDVPLRDVIFGNGATTAANLLDETRYTQPALFAVEVALVRLLESWGIQPRYVMGHSLGEITAAHVAGVLSLGDACELVTARSRLMAALPPGGSMMAVSSTEGAVSSLLDQFGGTVTIAAVNAPGSVVVSGDDDAVEELRKMLASRNVRTKGLRTSHAFHSHRMDPILEDFASVCDGLDLRRPTIDVISNLTGELAHPAHIATADYWVRHLRSPVRFMDGVQYLRRPGHADFFLEMGPGTALSAMVGDTTAVDDGDSSPRAILPVLRFGREAHGELVTAVAQAFVAGLAVDWAELFAHNDARTVDLPTYSFQRKSFWLNRVATTDLAASGLGATIHPMLGSVIDLAEGKGMLASGCLSLHSHPWLADHRVGGAVVLPGTAFVELALHVGSLAGPAALDELILQEPLVIPDEGTIDLQVVLDGEATTQSRTVVVHSRPRAAEGAKPSTWVCHARGVLRSGDVDLGRQGDAIVWPPIGGVSIDVGRAYEDLSASGYDYGTMFRGLRAVWRRNGEIFAEVKLPDNAGSLEKGFTIHPALLDAALHSLLISGRVGETSSSGAGHLILPFAWEGVSVRTAGLTELRVRIRATDADRFEIELFDRAGLPSARVRALTVREVPAGLLGISERGVSKQSALYTIDWTALPETDGPAPRGEWDEGTGDTDIRSVHVERCAIDGREVAVVRCCPPASAYAGAEQVRSVVVDVLHSLQNLLGDGSTSTIVVVTSGAVATHHAEAIRSLTGAAVWGLARTAQSENRGRVLVVDVDEPTRYRAAVTAAVEHGAEPQLAVRGDALLVPRLTRTGPDVLGSAELILSGGGWKVTTRGHGTLDGNNIVVVPDDSAGVRLQPGEVRVALRAVGLNFRDVLIALGMYPDPATPIGSEGAGVVVEVAESGVGGLQPGDRVMGLLPGMSPEVVVDHRMMVRIPEGMPFEQAAALPIAFATAFYALRDLASVSVGETVVVHAATGGVGMAAVQLARHWGMDVYATSSAAKWTTLRDMGFDDDHIGDTRSTEFSSKFAHAAIDVVLNSLTGEKIDASLALLSENGRFIEMGVTDVRELGQVAHRYPGVWYRQFLLPEAGPDRIHGMLQELAGLFANGVLQPVPVTTWDVRQTPAACRFLSQARHVGKNVLVLPPAWTGAGTVLVSGGTGGLGRRLALHLVAERGVRHLLLASRRGSAAPGAEELVADLSERGVQVDVVACDMSDRSAVRSLIAGIDQSNPLTAVVHVAGSVDDAIFDSQTAGHVERVTRPKVDAAWNLHLETRSLPLAAFVVYSSVAGTLGSPGQANYAAANAYLDALSQYRQRQGLPSTSIAWGVWEKTTEMTRHLTDRDLDRMRRSGMVPISDVEGMTLFDDAIATGLPSTVATGLDVAAIGRQAADTEHVPPLLRGIVRSSPKTPTDGRSTAASPLLDLAGRNLREKEQLILEMIRSNAASVLGHASAENVPADSTFTDLGFDSLGAVEFRNLVNLATGAKLPATVVFDHPTPSDLARYICAEIVPEHSPPADLLGRLDAFAAAVHDEPLEVREIETVAARMEEMIRNMRGRLPKTVEPVAAGSDEGEGYFDDDAMFEYLDRTGDPAVE